MPAPAFITSLLSSFPLIVYPEDSPSSSSASSSSGSSSSSSTALPTLPTLWIYGPGIDKESESFDVDCLRAQADAAFNGVKLETRGWELAEGAPGASLPALHLPNGDLLPNTSIPNWITKQSKNPLRMKEKDKGKESTAPKSNEGGYTVDGNDDEKEKERDELVRVQERTYTSLVETKLQPAFMAHLFLTPSIFKTLTVPLYFPQTLSHGTPLHPSSPFLTRYAYQAYARTYRLEMQGEVRKNLGLPLKGRVDLEEVQEGAEEALQMLETKLAERGSEGWFFGSAHPTSFDALLYANLHLIYLLHAPHLDAPSPLRKKLTRCPTLLSWAKRLHKAYFP